MKLLLIILNDLKDFIISELRIFVILICGLIVAFLSLLILFSFSLSSRNDYQKAFGYKTRTYGINFNDNLKTNEKNELIKNMQEIEGCPKVEEITLTSRFSQGEDKPITIIGYYAKRDIFYCTEGRKFNNEEKNNESSAIIPWVGFFDYSKQTSYLGYNFKLYGKSYKVVGIVDYVNPYTVYLPYNTYIKDKYDTSFVSITYSQRLDASQELELDKVFEKNNMSVNVQYPPEIDSTQEKEFLQRFLVYLCLITFALVNIISLFRFWIYKNASQFMIFRLCGAGNKKVYIIIMLESLIISTVIFFISYIIYYCITPILEGFEMNYSLNGYHIAIAYIIIISIIFSIVNKTALKIVRSTDVHTLRQGEA